MNSMLTLEEVKNYLDIEQDELERCIKERKLHAYKIGGVYIRFRKEEVLSLQSEIQPKKTKTVTKISAISRVSDFWRFNNFYVISILLVIALAVLIVRS